MKDVKGIPSEPVGIFELEPSKGESIEVGMQEIGIIKAKTPRVKFGCVDSIKMKLKFLNLHYTNIPLIENKQLPYWLNV